LTPHRACRFPDLPIICIRGLVEVVLRDAHSARTACASPSVRTIALVCPSVPERTSAAATDRALLVCRTDHAGRIVLPGHLAAPGLTHADLERPIGVAAAQADVERLRCTDAPTRRGRAPGDRASRCSAAWP
jgi:hypothetical protein